MADSKNKALPVGTVLRGAVYTYTVEKVLGQGSFGITYLASTLIKGPLGELPMPVAVKEFFAKDLDSRGEGGTVSARTEDGVAYRYAKAFQRESQNLSKMKHPGIVKVLEAFQTNGTYYYSMEYLPGGSLDDKVKGGGIPEAEALPMIAKIGEALAFMHRHKMMHLDLKPKNIMLKADGTPVIIDFGLSKQYDEQGEPESSTTIGLGTPGYAPIEQATQTTSGEFQPTLDIYALGATLYKMLTGKTPPAATLVLNKKAALEPELEVKNVSSGTVDAILKAMAPLMDDRPQRVEDFLSMLAGKRAEPEDEAEDETEPKPAPKPTPNPSPAPGPAPTPPGRKPKTWLWALLGGLAALAVAVFIFGGKSRNQGAGGNSGADTLAVVPVDSAVETPVAPPVNDPVPEAPGRSKITSEPAGAAVLPDRKDTGKKPPDDTHTSEILPDAQAAFRDGNYDRAAELCRLHYIVVGDSRADALKEKALACAKLTIEMNALASAGQRELAREKAQAILALNPDDKKAQELAAFEPPQPGNIEGEWVDLGLPSNTRWKSVSEEGSYDYDEAKSLFGSSLPTKEQVQELVNSCVWEWTGNGYRVTGPNGKWINLPVAGSYGFYWSSEALDSENAWGLYFISRDTMLGSYPRSYKFPVRLVQIVRRVSGTVVRRVRCR